MNKGNMNMKKNMNSTSTSTSTSTKAQERRIKTLLYLADGQESLQLSDKKNYDGWKAFLYEVLCEMEELGLLKSIITYPSRLIGEKEYQQSKTVENWNLNDARVGTVDTVDSVDTVTAVHCKHGMESPPVPVPVIRLSGPWLKDYGFCDGQSFVVYPQKGQLIIKKAVSGVSK
jgi:hypothetical protein